MAGSKGGIPKLFREKLIEIKLRKARGSKKSVVKIDENKEEHK